MLTYALRLTFAGFLENIGLISPEEGTRRRDAVARDIARGAASFSTEPVDSSAELHGEEINEEWQDCAAPAGGLVSKFWACDPANTADGANVANFANGPFAQSID
jgi:hypothetical protein